MNKPPTTLVGLLVLLCCDVGKGLKEPPTLSVGLSAPIVSVVLSSADWVGGI